MVKFTNDGLKLSKLKLAGKDNAEVDAVFPPAKKAKKTAAEETRRARVSEAIATRGADNSQPAGG